MARDFGAFQPSELRPDCSFEEFLEQFDAIFGPHMFESQQDEAFYSNYLSESIEQPDLYFAKKIQRVKARKFRQRQRRKVNHQLCDEFKIIQKEAKMKTVLQFVADNTQHATFSSLEEHQEECSSLSDLGPTTARAKVVIVSGFDFNKVETTETFELEDHTVVTIDDGEWKIQSKQQRRKRKRPSKNIQQQEVHSGEELVGTTFRKKVSKSDVVPCVNGFESKHLRLRGRLRRRVSERHVWPNDHDKKFEQPRGSSFVVSERQELNDHNWRTSNVAGISTGGHSRWRSFHRDRIKWRVVNNVTN